MNAWFPSVGSATAENMMQKQWLEACWDEVGVHCNVTRQEVAIGAFRSLRKWY
jgi:hypothetical protein